MTIHPQPLSPDRDRTPASAPGPRRDAPHGLHALHGPRGLQDRPTTDLQAHDHPTINAFALLDHRTRARALPLRDAPPGRYLSVEDGEDVRLIALETPIVHIGRGLNADVRLEDPRVSRRHAIIAQHAEGARLLDDRSANGTHLNGREVTVGQLADGDVLRLGRVVMRFVEIGPPARPMPLRRIPLASVARRQVSPDAA
ncbi:MAG TPA: FHA domain-containing protein [Solirubrobacteraceae bacterium]|nr:FHA domain-containing protein [Solirubrobacteraceae bacterium]